MLVSFEKKIPAGEYMAKNVLIISSSPRKHGNTELLCQSFAKGALESGHNVVEVFLNEKNIHFCQGCAFCEKNPGKCSQHDDMAEIILELVKCDVVVFASPVYFYSISGQMKTFIDRLVTIYRQITNKEIYYIFAAGDKTPNFKIVELCMRGLVSCFAGSKVMGMIQAGGVRKKGEVSYTEHLQEAYKMGAEV